MDTATGDTIHHNSDDFFHLVDELAHLNDTRHPPRIYDKVKNFVDSCMWRTGPETTYKYREIVAIAKRLMNDIGS